MTLELERELKMPSEAWRKGQKADSYSDNPYKENTQEFEDFHAAFTQKIRRGFNPKSNYEFNPTFYVPYSTGSYKGSEVVKKSKGNSYKLAKGK